MHALQETGKLNVLSRPYVLTRNNRMATITVADEVPIPSSTNHGTVDTADHLHLPRRHRHRPGGHAVDQRRRAGQHDRQLPRSPRKRAETVQIAEGLNPVVFSTRSASTRVAVKDGQTIVIGGLIQDQSSDTIEEGPAAGRHSDRGQPVQADARNRQAKTELLIFLTPYVAKEPDDLTEISDTEEQRSTLSQDKEAAEVYRRHMNAMRN